MIKHHATGHGPATRATARTTSPRARTTARAMAYPTAPTPGDQLGLIYGWATTITDIQDFTSAMIRARREDQQDD